MSKFHHLGVFGCLGVLERDQNDKSAETKTDKSAGDETDKSAEDETDGSLGFGSAETETTAIAMTAI